MPRRPRSLTPGRAVRATVAALTGWALGAAAETSPYYLGGSQTFGHESNLLRLADNQVPPDGYAQADSVRSTALLGGFDQTIGRQHAYGNLTVRNNHYGHNAIFNNTSYSASAGLEWQTIERLSGTVTASANRNLQRFNSEEIGFLAQRNLERVETLNAGVNLGLVTQYSLEFTGGHRQVTNSLQDTNVQSRNFNQEDYSAGVRWRPSAASTFGVSLGGTQGRYPKFSTNGAGEYVADRFRRTDVELSASLRPSGISTVEAKLSSGRTTYDLNQQRNFNGVTGSLAWGWLPTGKLRVNVNLSRDTGQDSYATAVFNVPATADYSRMTDTLRTALSYDYSSKVAFTASVTYYDRSLVRTIANPFLPLDASGRERTTAVTLGARWAPTRYALLGCDYNNEGRRASGELSLNLHATSYSCYGQITLQ